MPQAAPPESRPQWLTLGSIAERQRRLDQHCVGQDLVIVAKKGAGGRLGFFAEYAQGTADSQQRLKQFRGAVEPSPNVFLDTLHLLSHY